MKLLLWEAQKLLASTYYAPISEDIRVHMQLCDDDGVVEDLIAQSLYCDMRPHSPTEADESVRSCIFALGTCTYGDDKKLYKDVPQLAIIATVHIASLEEINDKLESVVSGDNEIFAFLESRRTGDLGFATKVSHMSWCKKRGELTIVDETEFAVKYFELLKEVGIDTNRYED